jgi:hypothetical protein
MTRREKTILFMLVIAVVHTVISWGGPSMFAAVQAQHIEPGCTLDDPDTWMVAGLLLAASARKADTCLEECARARQHCEQQDTHRPGSKENITWSKQCQGHYNQCMNGCK